MSVAADVVLGMATAAQEQVALAVARADVADGRFE